jgi:integrase
MVKHRKRGIKGAGSVYRRKSDGRWTGSFKLEGMDKPRYVYAPANNNTEREALDLLQKAIQEYKQGRIKTEEDQKLGDYMRDWFENVHKPTIYITTYVRYRTHVYKHIIPSLGEVPLRKLSAQQVQQFIVDKGREGLGPGTIKNMRNLLHSALDNAIKWKLLSENVCDQVTLPKIEEHEKVILTGAQMERLIEVANESTMGAFIKLGMMTGLRHGEMLALKWQDVDFGTGILSISSNVAYVELPGDCSFVEGKPKTEAGIRKIILPPFVLGALLKHKEEQELIKQFAGKKWRENGLIFCNMSGGYLRDDVSRTKFRQVLRDAGLPETMRVHDLRHNIATFLSNVLKYPPNFVQALLGHSDIAITLRMYVEKVDPEMLRPMMDDLNRLFGGKHESMHAHDLRYNVAVFLVSAFKYPQDFVHALLENNAEALHQVMVDLGNLFGGKQG